MKQSTLKTGCVIKHCTCNHEFQDERYGKKRRVHNVKRNVDRAVCTVCSKEN